MSEMISGLEAALAKASSPTWPQRARAAHDLAPLAAHPEAAEALVRLLLDVEDTAVTRHTAQALVRLGTATSVRLVALALAEADDNRADWILTGVHDALAPTDGAPDLPALCEQLARDPEAAVRRGAADLSAWADDTER